MSTKLKLVLGISAAVAVFLIIRIGLIIKDKVTTRTNIAPAASPIKNEFTQYKSAVLVKDSDHDSIPDREEIVYGTDPFKPDTDKDGYLDGEETATGHDPLDASDNSQTRPGIFDPKTPNLTDRMSNLTVASVINDDGKLNPEQVDVKDIDLIVTNLKMAAGASLFVEPVQDIELKITGDNSPEAVRRYLTVVTPIIETEVISPMRLARVDPDTQDATQVLEYYKKAHQSLLTVTVPSSWKNIHKQTLYLFRQIIAASDVLTDQAIKEDPVRAGFALNQLKLSLAKFQTLLTQAAELAKSQKVSTTDTIFEIIKY